AEDVGKPGETIRLSSPQALIPGLYHAYVMPRQWEMYDRQIRVTQTLPCWVLGRYRFSGGPYGTLESRRGEALQHALTAGDDLYIQIARVALGRWEQLEAKILTQVFADIRQQPSGSHARLLGLLGALGRYGDKSEFPRWIKKEIKACALGFPYPDTPAGEQEGAQLVGLACELLAGQLFPDASFQGGLTGRQQRKQAEARGLDWMQARAARGFDDWGSDEVYADSLMALSCLVDVARAEPVWELASVLMDKMFFSLALNSFRGVFGSSRGRAGTFSVRSGLMEATSGITRLMWGMGIWNQHVAGLVNLACMTKYELPPIFADIAAGLPGEIWNREQQGAGDRRVNKVTFRTPDAMLSSAQDYHAGRPGGREQVWQATLGPQCVVFTTHPGCSAEVDAHAPNFWLGNGVLPRVAQWKDTLIALYNLPADERLGFTHAYFPTAHFDEYALQGNTAFSRKGDGYLAISASQGLELVMEGRTAFRELRSAGRQNAWLCQVGRAALDGDFASFQQKVLAQETRVDGLRVEVRTLRGEMLALDWSGPFLRDGVEQVLEGFPHFDNPYTRAEFPCRQMEIKTDDYLLRLDFNDSI
nr:hypothetical protein [Anaerolinea sp.]